MFCSFIFSTKLKLFCFSSYSTFDYFLLFVFLSFFLSAWNIISLQFLCLLLFLEHFELCVCQGKSFLIHQPILSINLLVCLYHVSDKEKNNNIWPDIFRCTWVPPVFPYYEEVVDSLRRSLCTSMPVPMPMPMTMLRLMLRWDPRFSSSCRSSQSRLQNHRQN